MAFFGFAKDRWVLDLRTQFGGVPSRSIALLLVVWCLQGCSTMNERYYLQAHDPETCVTNYFRVDIKGSIWMSKAKYSVGFYDRSAVETLFGEEALRQRLATTRAEMFDVSTAEDMEKLAATLDAIKTARSAQVMVEMRSAVATAAGLVASFETRLAGAGELLTQLRPAIAKASAAVKETESLLSNNKTDQALRPLRTAQAILEAIRIAVDGTVLVRFFDGAGNEIDVTGKTQVIFVATDISRFAEALRQLADSESAQQDLMLMVMGPRIREAEMAAARVTASDVEVTAIHQRLGEITGPLAAIPSGTPTTDLAAVRKAILDAAVALIGTGQVVSSSAEIEAVANALEVIP